MVSRSGFQWWSSVLLRGISDNTTRALHNATGDSANNCARLFLATRAAPFDRAGGCGGDCAAAGERRGERPAGIGRLVAEATAGTPGSGRMRRFSLRYLVEDYVRHLAHHLDHVGVST